LGSADGRRHGHRAGAAGPRCRAALGAGEVRHRRAQKSCALSSLALVDRPTALARGPAAEEPVEWRRAVAPGVEVGEITAHGLALSRPRRGFESRWGHQIDRQSEIETYDVRIAVARTLPIPYMIVVDYVHPQLREHGRRGKVNFVFSV